MIKVGQIYKPKNNDNKDAIFVVTKTEKITDFYYVMWNDGSLFHHNVSEDYLELIAEYPTWQEAVNSKEFKGE